jgi:Tol biopolymer transport system component
VPDDAKYPDIAQDDGIVPADGDRPAAKPSQIVHASASEDQSLCWSPNGKWIAFHSHKDDSDDIWLRPAAHEAAPVRISTFGRGTEAGWPRWSRDGKSLMFTGYRKGTRHLVAYLIGMDQESGAVTSPAKEIAMDGFDAEVLHVEWLPDSATIAGVAKVAPGKHEIFTVPSAGGTPKIVYQFESEHDAPGLGASPDGREVAFVAPAPDGFFQIFRLSLSGGTPIQVTTDRTDKTQPAWSPDGGRIAFTVWNYQAQFWTLQMDR